MVRVKKREDHHYKRVLVEQNLLQYKDKITISERNKAIVEDYVTGATYKQLETKYRLTYQRIYSIIAAYVVHCRSI